MQTKLAKTLDNIFKYLVYFLISFIWCNYYSSNLKICLFTAIIVATFLSFVTTKIFYLKQDKKAIARAEREKFENTIIQLMFYTKEEQIDYFFNVLSFSNLKLEKTKEYIKLKSSILIPMFNHELTPFEYLTIFKNFRKQKVIILTNKLSDSLEKLLGTIDETNIKILTGTDVYFKIIKPAQCFPKQIVKLKSIKKLKLKELLYVTFNKKNARGYFFSGLFIMFLSFIYRFSLYYQIMGTILLLLSLFARFNTKFNKPQSNNILDLEKNTE